MQHEGIDTLGFGPDPNTTLQLPDGALAAGHPVITYVARNLEPYRGFHIFMRALQRIQKAHPTCHAVIAVHPRPAGLGRPRVPDLSLRAELVAAEAMACAAPIVASSMAPVREVIRDGFDGRLVDFHDFGALAQSVLELLAGSAAPRLRRVQAQRAVQSFDRAKSLPGYDRLLGQTATADDVRC